MTTPIHFIGDAIAATIRTSQTVADGLKSATTGIGETVGPKLYQLVEQSTENVGNFVTPFAENPVVQFATRVPGLTWLMAALGQVNGERVEREVGKLRQQFPADTPDQLAHRVMVDTTWRAAGIGLITNIIPPAALMLFAIDVGAIAALQAEMIYRIACIYGFSPTDPTRRGEVLGIWGLSIGSSGLLKTGLSPLEAIPGVGAIVGVGSDAGLLYGLGHLACRFYETKQQAASQ